MSRRSGWPNTAGFNSKVPASWRSSVVTAISIVSLLATGLLRGRGLGAALGRRRRLHGPGAARIRGVLGQRPLDRIGHPHVAAAGARHRALDQDQTSLGVDPDHLEVLHRDPPVTHVAGHLLTLEHLAGILALAGRAVRAMGDRDAVAGAQAFEAP